MKNRNTKADKRKMDSDEESSDEDGSANDDNSHPIVTIEDSDADTDSHKGSSESEDGSSSDTSSEIQVKAKKRKLMRPNELLSDSSDSGDETCEKCAICLRSILNQEVGSPEGCDHLFCSVCIIEWSKNSNVCPLDRQQFSIILVRKNKSGNVVKQLPVEEPKPLNISYEEEDDTYCEVCGESDREDTMLLCDGCQRGFHIECLTPPLEEVPAEEEWFCPNCAVTSSLEETNDILDNIDEELNQLVRHQRVRGTLTRSGPRGRSRTGTRIRTRLLERIRVAVNRIVRSCFLDADEDDDDEDDNDDEDEDFEAYDSNSEDSTSEQSIASENQPGTSGTQRKTKKASTSTKKRKTKRKRATKKSSLKKKTKRTTKKRKTGTKRKAKSKSTIRTKRVKIQNADGTVKIVKTRTYKRRRKQRVKKKVKTAASLRRSSGNAGIPKTVKGRLALTLGMVPPKRPGQLLPDVKIRSSRSELSGIDINRARAGIPRLHIFEPRHELQLFSSGSDGEGFAGDESGPVATLAQPRITISSIRDRKRAALLLQSTPAVSVKPKPIVEETPKEFDILSSILDSQAIWHSKNTDVKIHEDGSIEVLKKTEKMDKKYSTEDNKVLDVRGTTFEGIVTQAPMYPGSSSRPGAFRQYNRNSFGESRGNQDSSLSARSSVNQSGVGFSRFGGTPRNDREGYANYLNNMPQGPIPFCRGGPPLRFRMPSRQQLRRFPFPPRMNRSPWQNEEEDGENESKNNNKESQVENNSTEVKKIEEEDVDLYSDIETNVEKSDSPEREESSGTSYPALGPPPEPSAFLLGIDENGEVTDKKNTSEVYDPAEPCDSEDEMVIDENIEKAQSPDENASEPETSVNNYKSPSASPSEAKSPKQKQSYQRVSTEDEDDECPIFSIYSSASREFSQKEEEEREREIAEEKRKLEEKGLQDPKMNSELGEVRELSKIDYDNEQIEMIQAKVHSEVEVKICDPNMKRSKSVEKTGGNSSSFDMESEDKCPSPDDEDSVGSKSCPSRHNTSRSRSGTPGKCLSDSERSAKSRLARSSIESEKGRCKSSSVDRSTEKTSRRRSKSGESDSDSEPKKRRSEDDDDDDDEEEEKRISSSNKGEKNIESESESLQTKVATGLEGLDVEEVSSDNGDGNDFIDRRSLSSLSLSELSNRSQESPSRLTSKKKKKRKKRKSLRKFGKKYDDGGGDDIAKEKQKSDSGNTGKVENEDIENEGQGEKHRRRKSNSAESDRQILGNKENRTDKNKEKEKDLSWKKPSKKEKNYREGKKRSKERGRSRSKDRRKSRSCSPKKDKKKNKDRKKKSEKKKEIERYDVRKIVKNKEIRKTDAFGRDIISKSRSISRSRSRSPIRERSRNMLRRDSRSYTRSRSRSYRRGRSPLRKRYFRSRTKSRSKSPRRSFSRSRSRSRSIRKSKKKFKSKERLKGRSRSRGRKSRSRRRSLSRSRSRSPMPRMQRGKRPRSRRSWSHHSRSPSFSPRRSRSFSRSPVRVRRSYTRSVSSSWSRGRSSMPRATSLEKLTVVLKTKDRKKGKKKKEGKRGKREEERRKKVGNSKEVFASGDNVLVSVNFRNNNNASSNNNNGSVTNDTGRNARLDSSSPTPSSDRKKRRGSEYEIERVTKKSKKSSTISKNVVDMALSNSCSKRAKKLTRLSEKDAEVILNRKPVAVIDLDLSPYREQTPSPINVVVVSDSGSGDEGKEQTPQRQNIHGSPGSEPEKNKESADTQSANVSLPSSPVANGYLTGPKTPPEPQIKFSIAKPQQLRQIANPLGDDDDDEDDAEEDEESEFKRIESLDRRIEKELDNSHKGPNTPPEPRGPTTPKTPPSPQTSPDAYDPFEPTKSRSPTPSQDKENRKSPLQEKDEQTTISEISVAAPLVVSEMEPTSDSVTESQEDKPVVEVVERGEAIPVLETNPTVASSVQPCTPLPEARNEDSPERKISVVITGQQSKIQPQTASQKPYTPVLKPISVTQAASATTPPVSGGLTMPFTSFSLPSPTKTTRTSGVVPSQPVQISGIQRLQHRLGSPVNRTPNSVKSTPEKRSTPRTEPNDMVPSGTYRTGSKRNGEQAKQARPLQDSTNETIDMTVDMDDSPYSPASSEGDDLFDPPTEPTKPAQINPKTVQPGYKPPQSKTQHKSPIKQLSKFDLLFGPSGPTLSPLKVASKKPKTNSKPTSQPKPTNAKGAKKTTNSKRGISLKMDEDQLRILDELPSSAVELQVKDKFLKKLNRQERVVDEVKTVLKPHYARKHITKEEYKDILRRSVPKICHSRSGEINPSKIQSLIEAYVRKFRHAKKKGAGSNAVAKAKAK